MFSLKESGIQNITQTRVNYNILALKNVEKMLFHYTHALVLKRSQKVTIAKIFFGTHYNDAIKIKWKIR